MDVPVMKVIAQGHYANDLDGVSGEVYDKDFEALIKQILLRVGDDPAREGLLHTPQRVARAIDFLTSGYAMSVEEVVKDALFSDPCEEMVIVKDIEFYSLCEHHMLPFFGKVHVGYLPGDKIIGLSKIARLIDMFARRLQVQERLTSQIAQTLMKALSAQGTAVVVEASHFCMMMRGVQKQNSMTVTSSMLGVFRSDTRTRAEFMGLIRS